MAIADYLNKLVQLKNDLIAILRNKGIEVADDEKLNTLVPKVNEVEGESDIEWVDEIGDNITIVAKSNGSSLKEYIPLNNVVQYCKKIVLPEGITTISISTFINCRYLEEIILPETLTTLRYGAFYGCSSLKKIVIPSKVEFFGESGWISPVGECVSLTDITFLNPECDIFASEILIPKQTIIHGFHGSTAEEYSEKYNRTFVALD